MTAAEFDCVLPGCGCSDRRVDDAMVDRFLCAKVGPLLVGLWTVHERIEREHEARTLLAAALGPRKRWWRR